MNDVSALVGQTIKQIDKMDDEILFILEDGRRAKMYHDQDCCETVIIDDIVGDLNDLIDSPIIRAEERVSCSYESEWPTGEPMRGVDDSWTWTFYEISTNKGSVTIKWLGESNGYYSESVDFVILK